MKITKKKEVIEEEVEIIAGTYYFECEQGEFHKMELGETGNEGITNYRCTYVYNFSDMFGIKVREDYSYDEDGLPYKFSAFIRGISGKEIIKEKYETERKEVLKRIADVNK